jgi:hypothetical protein
MHTTNQTEKIFKIFCIFTLFISLYLNLPKYYIMYLCIKDNTNYTTNILQSSSNPLWLIIHLTISQLLLIIYISHIFHFIFFPQVLTILHYIFVIILILNIYRFANLSFFAALIINTIPLAIIIFTFEPYDYHIHTNKISIYRILYFLSLSSPIILEFIYLLKNIY